MCYGVGCTDGSMEELGLNFDVFLYKTIFAGSKSEIEFKRFGVLFG